MKKDKQKDEKNYFAINSEAHLLIIGCKLCSKIPQKSSHESRAGQYSSGNIPEEMLKLDVIVPGLKKCPLCNTFYKYSSYEDEGGVMEPAESSSSLERLSPLRAMEFMSNPAWGTDESARIRPELEALHEGYDSIISAMETAVRNGTTGLNWHIRKYMVEILTDHYLVQNNTRGFTNILLCAPDPVIRFETAGDLLYMKAEEYPAWCERSFTKNIHAAARKLLAHEKNGLIKQIVKALSDCLESDGTGLKHDPLFGYDERRISQMASSELEYLAGSGVDIGEAVPRLVMHLGDENAYDRSSAGDTLLKYMGRRASRARQILGELENRAYNTAQFMEVRDKCIRLIGKSNNSGDAILK